MSPLHAVEKCLMPKREAGFRLLRTSMPCLAFAFWNLRDSVHNDIRWTVDTRDLPESVAVSSPTAEETHASGRASFVLPSLVC